MRPVLGVRVESKWCVDGRVTWVPVDGAVVLYRDAEVALLRLEGGTFQIVYARFDWKDYAGLLRIAEAS
jgi:hypothetical protein